MNNRYLYRAKRTDNGEWVEGNLIHVKKDYYICENPYECMDEYSSLNGQSYGFGGFKFVDPSTICQCTGLKDKNGKLIWENDIMWLILTINFRKIPHIQELCGIITDSVRKSKEARIFRHLINSTKNTLKYAATFSTIRNCWRWENDD